MVMIIMIHSYDDDNHDTHMTMILYIHVNDDNDDELHFPVHLPEETIVDKLKMHEIDNNEDHHRHHHLFYQLSRHCSYHCSYNFDVVVIVTVQAHFCDYNLNYHYHSLTSSIASTIRGMILSALAYPHISSSSLQ